MDSRVTPAKRVTYLVLGPPPPCKQALSEGQSGENNRSFLGQQSIFLTVHVYMEFT